MKTSLRLFTLATVAALAGCATPMEDLVHEATISGDWSAVEHREWFNERRRAGNLSMLAGSCGQNHVAVMSSTGNYRCERTDVLDNVLTPRTRSAIR